MKIAIVGLGLIGGSIALELKSKSFCKEMVGVDSNRIHVAEAIRLGFIDRDEDFSSACKTADLVILSVPVGQILHLLPLAMNQLKAGATVLDVGSTKGKIAEAVESHPARAQYVATHPMAGTEFSGPTAAKMKLFQGKAAVICDREKSSLASVELATQMYAALGMRLIFMNSEAHDLHAAYVSHLSHITSFVLANTVLDKEKNTEAIFDLASGGFESTVRLAKSSPAMWAPIFEQNCEQVSEALGSYIEQLKIFHQALLQKDFTKTEILMRDANRIERVLSEMKKTESPT